MVLCIQGHSVVLSRRYAVESLKLYNYMFSEVYCLQYMDSLNW